MTTEEPKKEGIKCPACGIENPRNRLTCEVCGERLSPRSSKLNPFGDSNKEEKMSSKKRKSKNPEPANTIPESLPITKEETPSPLPVKKERKQRRRRAKPVKDSLPTFFILQKGRLQAVHIIWGVMRPLKRKDLSRTERSLLSVWNRNKDLIKSD